MWGNKTLRIALRLLKETLANTRGFICLSGTWKEPLLWSHYADRHRGMCLGFEINGEEKFRRVTYSADRPTLNFDGVNEADMQRRMD